MKKRKFLVHDISIEKLRREKPTKCLQLRHPVAIGLTKEYVQISSYRFYKNKVQGKKPRTIIKDV